MVFPLPNGTVTVLLRSDVRSDGARILNSTLGRSGTEDTSASCKSYFSTIGSKLAGNRQVSRTPGRGATASLANGAGQMEPGKERPPISSH